MLAAFTLPRNNEGRGGCPFAASALAGLWGAGVSSGRREAVQPGGGPTQLLQILGNEKTSSMRRVNGRLRRTLET